MMGTADIADSRLRVTGVPDFRSDFGFLFPIGTIGVE